MMSKTAVIYWSGTGNTEAMAKAVAEGAGARLFTVSEISAGEAAGYDRLALGCPAMGAEVLEEGEFEPFFTALEGRLSAPAVMDRAVGSMPTTMVRVVMKIGRSRTRPAWRPVRPWARSLQRAERLNRKRKSAGTAFAVSALLLLSRFRKAEGPHGA